MVSLRHDDDTTVTGWFADIEAKAQAPVSTGYGYGIGYGTGLNQSVPEVPLYLNTIVAASIGWLGRNLPVADLQVISTKGGEDGPEVPDHDFILLMDKPNPIDDFYSFWQAFVLSDVIRGDTLFVKVRNRMQGIHSFWWIAPWDFQPIPNRDKNTNAERPIECFEVTIDGKVKEYPPEDVVHIKDGKDPSNPYRGMSPLLAGLRSASTIDRADYYTQTLMRNCGAISGVLSPAHPDMNIDPKNVDKIQAQFAKRTTGENSGRPLVSTQSFRFDKMALSPEEMLVDKIRDFPAATLCSLMGTNLMVLGLPDPMKTYTNLAEGDRQAWSNGLIPRMTRAAESFDRQCPELIKPNQRLKWDFKNVKALQEDWVSKTDALVKAAGGKPILTVNEAREAINLERIEGQDELPEPAPPPDPLALPGAPGIPPKQPLGLPAPKDKDKADDEDVETKATASAGRHSAAVKMVRDAVAAAGLSKEYRAGPLTADQRRKVILALSDMAEQRLRYEAESLVAEMAGEEKGLGKAITDKVNGFFKKAGKIVRTAYLAATLALTGSLEPLTAEAARVHQTEVRRQVEYLRAFQAEVLAGDQPPDGTLAARAEMYGASTWGVAQNTAKGVAASFGMSAGKRIHVGSDNPCPDCDRLQALDWMPIDELTPIGTSECRSRCHCHFIFRDEDGTEYDVLPARGPLDDSEFGRRG